jgi:hypothetical protein
MTEERNAEARPHLLTFRSGGWVLLLAAIVTWSRAWSAASSSWPRACARTR